MTATPKPPRFRCCACGEPFVAWAAAQRHADDKHSPGCTIEWIERWRR